MGQGAKPKGEANYVMATLWPGKEGLELFDQKIGSRIERLPGFLGFQGIDGKSRADRAEMRDRKSCSACFVCFV